MSDYFSKILRLPFDEAVTRTLEPLKKEGFGVLTDIDVQGTLKQELGVDFQKYRILTACNPPCAYEALRVASMQAVKNADLMDLAQAVQQKLKNVVINL